MPELPEVEALRRSLVAGLVGRRVVAVAVGRADVVVGPTDAGALLVGQRIADLPRHGKQLAVVGEGPRRLAVGTKCHVPRPRGTSCHPLNGGRVVCVHLGMSGSVTLVRDADQPPRPHTHIAWTLDDGSQLRFADARRFGGLWTFPDLDALHRERWSRLGPDALTITPRKLAQGLIATRRGLKAALLDQAVVAGLGNIYVDELLFRIRLHPLAPACAVAQDLAGVRRLVGVMRRLLAAAADRGGSSLRDYINGQGEAGRYQLAHRVYGRAGQTCTRCRATLVSDVVAGRTTVWCPSCQGHR